MATVNEFVEHIRALIENNQIKKAINGMKLYFHKVDNDIYNKIFLYSASFKQNEDGYLQGLNEDSNNAKIILSLLNILVDLEDKSGEKEIPRDKLIIIKEKTQWDIELDTHISISEQENKEILVSSTKLEIQQEIPTQKVEEPIVINNKPKEINGKVKVALFYPDPLDKKLEIDITKIKNIIKSYDMQLDYHYLSLDNLDVNGYDYFFIVTQSYKKKVYIEDEFLRSRLVSLNEIEERIIDMPRAVIFFVNEYVNFQDISSPFIQICLDDKALMEQFFFKAFKKPQLESLVTLKIKYINISEDNLYQIPKGIPSFGHSKKTSLPELIDPKNVQNFVGRATDLVNIIEKVVKVKDNQQALTVKGSGGIGKTTTVSKVIVELSYRGYFSNGIYFIACENIIDFKAFEYKITQCFDLDNIIDFKEHLRENYNFESFNKLIILDNFESLLTLADKSECDTIKELVRFICDYVTILITSREVIGYDFEDVYPLNNLTTEEAYQLFCNCAYKGDDKRLSVYDKRMLRQDIIENLLNNNPLAIKLVTQSFIKIKSIEELKKDLEENFFSFTSEDMQDVFDKDADTNIERKKSLYNSINYSYLKLKESEKLSFELLHLFPDGISLKNFKECFNDKKTNKNRISDNDIRSLLDKSMLESSDDKIYLQSIMARFASYQFEKRDSVKKMEFYNNAYEYNATILETVINTLEHKIGYENVLYLMSNIINNFIFILDYLEYIYPEDKEKPLNFIVLLSPYVDRLGKHSIISFINKLDKNIEVFNNINNSQILLKICKWRSIYYASDFDKSYNELKDIISFSEIKKLNLTDNKINGHIKRIAFNIYSMEGYTLECIQNVIEHNLTVMVIYNHLFYCGYFYVSKNNDDFYDFEIAFILKTLRIDSLEKYIKSIYSKNHLEKMQATYCLSKSKRVESIEIKKLVVTNPYTKGLKALMLAFVEEESKKRIQLYEKAIHDLEHIKYYHIEAIYFYAKYLKSIQHDSYQIWFDKGYEMADRFYYRYLKHCFLDLQNGTETLYIEENYPIPLNKSEVDSFIKKAYKDGYIEVGNKHTKTEVVIAKPKKVNLIYVEGITDKMILEKAVSYFSKDSSIIRVETAEGTTGGGVNWVKDKTMSWIYEPNKKEKLFVLLDNDEVGRNVKKDLQADKKFKMCETNKLIKVEILPKPTHITLFHKKEVFNAQTNYDFSIEGMFPLSCWEYAKSKKWLIENENIAALNFKLSRTETAESFILSKGIDSEYLVYIFQKLNPDKKIDFAKYLCNQDKEVFIFFESIIQKIDDFFKEN